MILKLIQAIIVWIGVDKVFIYDIKYIDMALLKIIITITLSLTVLLGSLATLYLIFNKKDSHYTISNEAIENNRSSLPKATYSLRLT